MKLRASMQIIVGMIFSLLIVGTCYSQVNHQLVEVQKAIPGKSHFVEIPGSFSHEKITESNVLKRLQSKKIRRVELIYTRYKENENFDQNKLNEDRMFRLYQLLPKLQIDQPEIIWIEQTGATTREEAKGYFHGFRIYTDVEEKQVFKRMQREDSGNSTENITVDNSKGGVFSVSSGTQIQIPANAVIYEDGKPVSGNYTISYKEYRNAAEMAFSGIPMVFQDKTGEYQFNSAGMYEIRGMKDGRPLELQKEIIVDFNCTKKEAGVNFYHMDDQTGEWALLQSELFAPKASPVQATSVVTISRGVLRRSKAPVDSITRSNFEGLSPDNQYPNLVEGLRSEKFGVYNCDQVYRVANKVSISPKYLDASTQKAIKNDGVLCLIDKDINASFRFSPQNITCNSKGNNVFLLFTEAGEVFVFQNDQTNEQSLKAKDPVFLMENITDKVKTSDDLKKYLSI
ncbi:hypothetical protein [Fluviicola sp.]|uniref:hypothetical protein n=1 Tax=Fluviicola sp. TaxID=1917219 RepID=UPI00261F4F20|nr:hypothetical protein [Fluviicola sp.]